jgi:methylmalonyl-CoA mutase C-terminal domain/subunit
MKKIRILFGRYTLDGHDRGLHTVMRKCRDDGMEVIYVHFTAAEQIAQTAIQEAVDVIGITASMGQHFLIAQELFGQLREKNYDIPVIMGGVIPTVDVPRLLEMGIKSVFGPASAPAEASEFIAKLCQEGDRATA